MNSKQCEEKESPLRMTGQNDHDDVGPRMKQTTRKRRREKAVFWMRRGVVEDPTAKLSMKSKRVVAKNAD